MAQDFLYETKSTVSKKGRDFSLFLMLKGTASGLRPVVPEDIDPREVAEWLVSALDEALLCCAHPHARVVKFLVGLVLTVRISNLNREQFLMFIFISIIKNLGG
jgi:hypothetical protein